MTCDVITRLHQLSHDALRSVASGDRMMRLVKRKSAVTRADATTAAHRAEVFVRVGKPLPTSFDAGVDLRDVKIAARHADPRTTTRYDRAARTSTGTRTTSSPPTWPPAPDQACVSQGSSPREPSGK
jgi:hypothetical protein